GLISAQPIDELVVAVRQTQVAECDIPPAACRAGAAVLRTERVSVDSICEKLLAELAVRFGDRQPRAPLRARRPSVGSSGMRAESRPAFAAARFRSSPHGAVARRAKQADGRAPVRRGVGQVLRDDRFLKSPILLWAFRRLEEGLGAESVPEGI